MVRTGYFPKVKPTTSLHPVPRLRMRGATPPLPHSTWRGA